MSDLETTTPSTPAPILDTTAPAEPTAAAMSAAFLMASAKGDIRNADGLRALAYCVRAKTLDCVRPYLLQEDDGEKRKTMTPQQQAVLAVLIEEGFDGRKKSVTALMSALLDFDFAALVPGTSASGYSWVVAGVMLTPINGSFHGHSYDQGEAFMIDADGSDAGFRATHAGPSRGNHCGISEAKDRGRYLRASTVDEIVVFFIRLLGSPDRDDGTRGLMRLALLGK